MKSTRYMSYSEWENLSTEERDQTQKASPEEQAWLDRLKALLDEIPEGLQIEVMDELPDEDEGAWADGEEVPRLTVWKTYCQGVSTTVFSCAMPKD